MEGKANGVLGHHKLMIQEPCQYRELLPALIKDLHFRHPKPGPKDSFQVSEN